MSSTEEEIHAIIDCFPNLVSPLLNGKIVFATDEWFACAERMLRGIDWISALL